jgi:hypothetical protein
MPPTAVRTVGPPERGPHHFDGPRRGVPGCYDPAVDRAGLRAWIELYERAWRTAATDLLTELFASGATYQTAPFEEPYRGLPAIAAMWQARRAGPDEVFAMRSEIVAVERDTGVARVEVRYGDPVGQQWRDLWGGALRPRRPVHRLRGVAFRAERYPGGLAGGPEADNQVTCQGGVS